MSDLSPQQTLRPATPPHPPLLDYYASGDERQKVVNSMFDDSAAYYEWICRVFVCAVVVADEVDVPTAVAAVDRVLPPCWPG